MKEIILPPKESWEKLCRRPEITGRDLVSIVRNILKDVKSNSDKAVQKYSKKFDGALTKNIAVSPEEILRSASQIPGELKEAINTAWKNIESFHSSQIIPEPAVETIAGVKCWRRSLPVQIAGLYVPGGSAPLFSTLLMLGIPAKLAGCEKIIVCTPPSEDGMVSPLILYTAQLLGISAIFKAGGAQAIAAMAYGTETIPKVNKIFGPGNQYVTKAKELVQQDGIAIDMPAGPSEVLVIADKYANPGFIAADLISQAEHGPDSQVILLTDNRQLLTSVKSEIDEQVALLLRKEIAMKALENSKLILLNTIDECMDFGNLYAPEHLIINTVDANSLAVKVKNAGSVFLGKFSCESAGDYASGTNHTLPTNGFAKNHSGVSVDSFVKKITFQEISEEGMINLGPAIELMAEAESLTGHRNAVSVRLKNIKNG